ncbi:Kae1-associated serine/threonine protein kinase [Candidatus Micrarchaeota archaeon]|nr:Kae1-associated serine/threonine protein kinase [Candidatus Micrarchaeota archaeon]
MRGAEAELVEVEFLGHACFRKERRKKGYRIAEIDSEIRLGRTRREARLLHKAKSLGVLCPVVYAVGADYIVIGKVLGRKLSDSASEVMGAGRILGKLHSGGIVHGDFTSYNLIVDGAGKIHVIDFGLGFSSRKVEDFADDVITMVRSLGGAESPAGKKFLEGYSAEFAGSKSVLKKIGEIEARARYM